MDYILSSMEPALNLRALGQISSTLLPLALASSTLFAEPIAVRQTQGATRGFLTVRSEDGKVLGHGDLIQTAHGEHVTSRMVYHFRDGSLDDETVTYVQHRTFQLVSDHHIQRGSFFPKPSDTLVDVGRKQVTTRSGDKDGTPKVEVQPMDLPPDLYNGMVGTVLLNTPPDTPEFKVGMVAPTGKGRLIKLAILPDGHGTFSAVGVRRPATIFRVEVELGGVTGVIAPLVGKQPADTLVWVLKGEVPALIRQIGQMYEGGPVVDIQVSGTSFPKSKSVAR